MPSTHRTYVMYTPYRIQSRRWTGLPWAYLLGRRPFELQVPLSSKLIFHLRQKYGVDVELAASNGRKIAMICTTPDYCLQKLIS